MGQDVSTTSSLFRKLDHRRTARAAIPIADYAQAAVSRRLDRVLLQVRLLAAQLCQQVAAHVTLRGRERGAQGGGRMTGQSSALTSSFMERSSSLRFRGAYCADAWRERKMDTRAGW